MVIRVIKIPLMLKDRYLNKCIIEDLSEKMVFVGGPRQVGKTTLARELVAPHFNVSSYYNWDNRSDRSKIMRSEWPGNAQLIILDEIHKYKDWKNYLKGVCDRFKEDFLIEGPSRTARQPIRELSNAVQR